jgi:TonB family protein
LADKKYPMAEAVRAAYRAGQEDEAMEPLVRVDPAGKPVGSIRDGDYVIFYDIRGEREVELTAAFTAPVDVPQELPAESALDLGVEGGVPGGVEGGVPGGVVREPRKIKDVPPVYPELAKRARIQGVVILECVINPQGRVENVKVLRGLATHDEPAVEAVRQWTYTPTLVDGVPASVVMTVTVNFFLRNPASR